MSDTHTNPPFLTAPKKSPENTLEHPQRRGEGNSLSEQILGCVLDVVVGERGHGVITVVVVRLVADIDALLVAGFFGRFGEILGKELSLFVEVVARSLDMFSRMLEGVMCLDGGRRGNTRRRSTNPMALSIS